MAAAELGAAGYIRKPFTHAELLAVITEGPVVSNVIPVSLP